MGEVTVDDRGRIYLPKDMRKEYGRRFRAVKLEDGIKLIPLSDDPIEGLKEAVNGAKEVDIQGIDETVERKARKEIEEDLK